MDSSVVISSFISILIATWITIKTKRISKILNEKYIFPGLSPYFQDSSFFPTIFFMAGTISFIIIFPVIFCTIDLLNRKILSLAFWDSEIKDGLIQLRITTYLLSYNMAKSAITLIKNKYSNNCTELDFKLSISHFSQFGFFLSITTFLWICYNFDVRDISTIITSWGLLFIFDDWVIITEYTKFFNRDALPSHLKKILFLDFLLLISIMVTTFQNLSIAMLLTTLFAANLLFILNCFFTFTSLYPKKSIQ